MRLLKNVLIKHLMLTTWFGCLAGDITVCFTVQFLNVWFLNHDNLHISIMLRTKLKRNWILSSTLCSTLFPFSNPTVVDQQRKKNIVHMREKNMSGWLS
jgi:hypothetical protein